MSVGRGKGALNPCNLKFDAFLLNFQHKKLFASFRMSTMKFHHCWLIPGKIHNWPLLWKKPSDAHDVTGGGTNADLPDCIRWKPAILFLYSERTQHNFSEKFLPRLY